MGGNKAYKQLEKRAKFDAHIRNQYFQCMNAYDILFSS